jgi:hypothetical protein
LLSQATNLERALGVIRADTFTTTLRRASIMLTKALIAALVAIALAVVAPAAGAATVKPKAAATHSAAASAPKSDCLTITRVILGQEGADPDPDDDEPLEPDVDSSGDEDPGRDTDADTGPDTRTSDNPWEPGESNPDGDECEQ